MGTRLFGILGDLSGLSLFPTSSSSVNNQNIDKHQIDDLTFIENIVQCWWRDYPVRNVQQTVHITIPRFSLQISVQALTARGELVAVITVIWLAVDTAGGYAGNWGGG